MNNNKKYFSQKKKKELELGLKSGWVGSEAFTLRPQNSELVTSPRASGRILGGNGCSALENARNAGLPWAARHTSRFSKASNVPLPVVFLPYLLKLEQLEVEKDTTVNLN
jgi:hypothetical protein